MTDEALREELKPCPFCGAIPEQFSNNNAFRCKVCGRNSGWMSRKDWNTRVEDVDRHRLEALNKRYRDALRLCADEKVVTLCYNDENKLTRQLAETILEAMKEGKP